MARVTTVLRNLNDRYPDGTALSLYRRTLRDGRWSPDMSAVVSTATVTSGMASFTNVPSDAGGLVAVPDAGGMRIATMVGSPLSWASSH